jgi:hypothetical protein
METAAQIEAEIAEIKAAIQAADYSRAGRLTGLQALLGKRKGAEAQIRQRHKMSTNRVTRMDANDRPTATFAKTPTQAPSSASSRLTPIMLFIGMMAVITAITISITYVALANNPRLKPWLTCEMPLGMPHGGTARRGGLHWKRTEIPVSAVVCLLTKTQDL